MTLSTIYLASSSEWNLHLRRLSSTARITDISNHLFCNLWRNGISNHVQALEIRSWRPLELGHASTDGTTRKTSQCSLRLNSHHSIESNNDEMYNVSFSFTFSQLTVLPSLSIRAYCSLRTSSGSRAWLKNFSTAVWMQANRLEGWLAFFGLGERRDFAKRSSGLRL